MLKCLLNLKEAHNFIRNYLPWLVSAVTECVVAVVSRVIIGSSYITASIGLVLWISGVSTSSNIWNWCVNGWNWCRILDWSGILNWCSVCDWSSDRSSNWSNCVRSWVIKSWLSWCHSNEAKNDSDLWRNSRVFSQVNLENSVRIDSNQRFFSYQFEHFGFFRRYACNRLETNDTFWDWSDFLYTIFT